MIEQTSGSRLRPPTVPPAPPLSPEFFQDDFGRRRTVYRHLTNFVLLLAASVWGSYFLFWWMDAAAVGSAAWHGRRVIALLYLLHSSATLPLYLCRRLGRLATLGELLISLILSGPALANLPPVPGEGSGWLLIAALPPLTVVVRCLRQMVGPPRATNPASPFEP